VVRLLPAPLEGPAAIGVYLRPLRLRPVCGHRAGLDRRLLGLGEPRPSRLDHGRIDDRAGHREVAGAAQQRIEAREQPRDRARFGQLLADSQIVLASRTGSCSARPKKRMNESRSRI
jgi:hypothetical protein